MYKVNEQHKIETCFLKVCLDIGFCIIIGMLLIAFCLIDELLNHVKKSQILRNFDN